MASQDDHDNSGAHDNAVFPAYVTIQTEMFDARVLFSDEPGGLFVAVTQEQINERHSQEFGLSQLTQGEETQDTAVAPVISVPANHAPTTAVAVPKKRQCKDPTRAKQCLLANEDVVGPFLSSTH